MLMKMSKKSEQINIQIIIMNSFVSRFYLGYKWHTYPSTNENRNINNDISRLIVFSGEKVISRIEC